MPDYIFMLESRLTPEQLEVLNRVQQEAQDLSLNLYLVGGAVRDLMTGSLIRDLDFAAEGNPSRLVRRLQAGGVRRVETDELRHSTELVLANGVSLSLSMARNEFFRQPGKPPDVRPASIMEDLRRRDFSMNAMGISLTPGSRGLLLDPTNGLADIDARQLRILHNYSFLHDPVRLLRLVRFSTRLGFRPDARTRELFAAALQRGYQDYIEPKVLGLEAEQIAQEDNAVAVLKALAEHELLAVLHPMLQKRAPDYVGLAKLQKYRHQALEAGYRVDALAIALHYIRRRLPSRAQKALLRNLALDKLQLQEVFQLEAETKRLAQQLGQQRNLRPLQNWWRRRNLRNRNCRRRRRSIRKPPRKPLQRLPPANGTSAYSPRSRRSSRNWVAEVVGRDRRRRSSPGDPSPSVQVRGRAAKSWASNMCCTTARSTVA